MRGVPIALMILAVASPAWAIPSGQAVKWQEYGPSALQQAKREGKPLFLLITATWCQWCQTYEHESLHTPEVAAVLNTRYVPVWVDFDRRPDVAARFPGRGLPRTVILNPNGGFEASVAGFIPKPQLLDNLNKTLSFIDPRAESSESPRPATTKTLAPEKLVKAALDELERQYDPIYHGFGREAKQPYPGVLTFMLEGGESARLRVSETLKALAGEATWQNHVAGGLFDSREGGFFRYSTRRNWSHPHVEKLLGLNAQLVSVALEVYHRTHDPKARAWAEATLRYLEGRLGAGHGEFYGSQAADPAYYRLPPEERRKRPAPSVDRRHFAASSAQMALALFEAEQILKKPVYGDHARQAVEALAKRVDAHGAIAHDWADGRESALRGLLDDQAWAALAMLEAWSRTGKQAYLTHAEALLAFTKRENRASAGYRLNKDGPVEVESNAAAALAFARAYQLTGKQSFAQDARHALIEGMDRDLDGGYGWLAARLLGRPRGR